MLDLSQTGISLFVPVRNEAGQVIDFVVSQSNVASATVLGMTREQTIGRRLTELLPSVARLGLLDLLIGVLENNQPFGIPELRYDTDGLNGWFNVLANPHSDGIILTFLDITATKEAQLAQNRQADQVQQILDHALTAIAHYEAIRDEAGKIIDFYFRSFNRTAEQMTGLKAADVVGGRMLQMFPEVGRSGLFEKWVELVETGVPTRFQSHYNDGNIELWYDTQATKWGDGFIQSYIDVSPMMQTQRELERLNRDLTRSNDNLQQFAFAASHDLQEPLRKIQSFSSLIEEQHRHQLDERGLDLFRRMKLAAQRMAVLVKDLLFFSRLTTQPDEYEPVSLSDITRDVLSDLELAIQESSATFKIDELTVVRGNARQLTQLFQNLISNAIKFRHPDRPPTVEITSRLATPDEIAAIDDLDRNRTYTLIRIEDNGIGFNEQYADRIFGLFQRLHGRNEYDGSGIGLTLAQKVVHNHNGHIRAYGREGEGSSFVVLLPVA